MHSPLKTFTGLTAALAFCLSPTMASAATSSTIQTVSPLVAVSVFGTQASAQTVCASAAGAAAAAGAVAAQANPNCVLPVGDAAPPPPVSEAVPPPTGDFGISPVLLALAGLALAGGIIAALSDDDDGGRAPISPA